MKTHQGGFLNRKTLREILEDTDILPRHYIRAFSSLWRGLASRLRFVHVSSIYAVHYNEFADMTVDSIHYLPWDTLR